MGHPSIFAFASSRILKWHTVVALSIYLGSSIAAASEDSYGMYNPAVVEKYYHEFPDPSVRSSDEFHLVYNSSLSRSPAMRNLSPLSGSEIEQPRSLLQFVVKPKVCLVTPDVRTFPEARHFVVECPTSVDTVELQFIDGEEGSHTMDEPIKQFVNDKLTRPLKVFDVSGNRLTALKKYPVTGKIETIEVQGCLDFRQPVSCDKYRIDIIRADDTTPVLQSLWISNSPHGAPQFDESEMSYTVKLHSNEPVTITAVAEKDFFVDFVHPKQQSRAIEKSAIWKYTPTATVDGKERFLLYVTNRARSIITTYTVNVEAIASTDARLGSLSVWPGRLEPDFDPDTYLYLARVPEGTTTSTIYLEGMNRKDVDCKVDGAVKAIVGKGHFSIPPMTRSVEVHCVAADGSHNSRYVIRVIRQLGGSTLLKSLSVVGADRVVPEFDGVNRGPYSVDMRSSGKDDRWVAFEAIPENPHAIVEVEGSKVDPIGHISPFFQVRLGDKKQFRVMVSTVENYVKETYYVDVDRISTSWYEDDKQTGRYSNALGWISTIVSSTRATHFIHNANFLQFISVTSRLNGLPSTYLSFAENMNKFNMQYGVPSAISFKDYSPSIHVNDYNWTATAVSEDKGMVISGVGLSDGMVDVSQEFNEQLNSIVHSIRGTTPLSVAEPETASVMGHLPYAEFSRDASGAKLREITVRSLLGAWGGSDVAVDPNEKRTNGLKHQQTSVIVSPNEAVIGRLNHAQTRKVMDEVQARYNEEMRFMDFASSMMMTTAIVTTLGVVYTIVWMFILQGDSASNPGFRKDFPAFLHPTRFWFFVFDYAFISYSQAACGLAFAGTDMVLMIGNVAVTPRLLIAFAGIMILAFPATFLGMSAFVLSRIKDDLVYAKSLQSYTDRSFQEVKAFRRWLHWMPLVNNFLTVEITSVAPVQSIDGDSSPVTFEADTSRAGMTENRAMEDAMEISNRRGEYTTLLNETDSVKYKESDDVLKVEFGAEKYDHRIYRVMNSRACADYPEAEVGRATYMIKTSYDVSTKITLQVQLQHLFTLATSTQRYQFWVKRDNLDIKHASRWQLLFGKAPKESIFYWVIERAVIFSIIFCLSCWNDITGLTQTILMASAFMVPIIAFTPSMMFGGTSRWYHNFKKDVKLRQIQKERTEMQKGRVKIWPFEEYPAARHAYLSRRQQKKHSELCGAYGLYERFIHDPIKQVVHGGILTTRTFATFAECLLGPVGLAGLKSLTLLTLFLGNHSLLALSRNMVTSSIAIFFVTLAAVCINSESLTDFYRLIQEFLYEMSIYARRLFIFIGDLKLHFARLEYYVQLVAAVSAGRPYPMYTTSASLKSRHLPVSEVSVVQASLGLIMPGYLKLTPHQKIMKSEDESQIQIAPSRYDARIDKLLVTSGSLSGFRFDNDRQMPIQMGHTQFHSRGATNPEHCVATVQIANHGSFRFPHGDTKHQGPKNDSYLSLFTDTNLLPEFGRVRKRHKYHGYSIRYEKRSGEPQVVVVGPSIDSGADYQLYVSGQQRPPRTASMQPDYSDSEESDVSDDPSAVVHARVTEPGRLSVPVPRRRSPDLDELIEVDPPIGNTFDIDPAQIAVDYDTAGHLLHLSHRYFTTSNDTYTVKWRVKNFESKTINITGTAHQAGVVRFPWRSNSRPDMDSLLVLKNLATEKSVQIDPRDTDAHEFLLPSSRLSGVAALAYSAVSVFPKMLQWVKGDAMGDDILLGPVPCTIVQCVDPIGCVYRVEPNFTEAAKKIRSEVERCQGMKSEINLPDTLGSVAASLMSQSDLIKFWRHNGIDIVNNGYWVNPLTDTTHPSVRGKKKEIKQTEGVLRIEVARRVERRLRKLQEVATQVKVWSAAYTNPELRLALATRDSLEWQGDEYGLKNNRDVMARLMRQYENAASNFVYPMHLSAKSIRRTANMATQVRHWRHVLSKWLVECEAASTELYAGNQSCLQNTVDQVMNALQRSLHRPDHLCAGRLSSTLHFVLDSRAVRGSDPEWMPDPLGGVVAYCRVWRTIPHQNDQADFFRSPFWMPCLLKLDGDRIAVSISDRAAKARESPYYWKSSRGWHIPLRAFETVTCINDNNIPAGATEVQMKGMNTRLTFYKAQRTPVSDSYALRLHDDKLDNIVRLGGETYRLMIGHTVHHETAARYSEPEIEPALTIGDEINCFPLQFRIAGSDYTQWESTIKNAYMNRPPRQVRHLYDPTDADSESSIEVPAYSQREHQSSPQHHATRRYDSHSRMDSPRQAHKPADAAAAARWQSHEQSELSSFSSSESDSEDHGIVPSSATSEAAFGVAPVVSASPGQQFPKGSYRGDWKDHRFDGWGKLFNNSGKLVYDGQWKGGKRWGRGTCRFTDRRGIEWMYDGFFIDDEMCGGGLGGRRPGMLKLVDEKEIARLKSSVAREDRSTIVSFEGTFRLPRRARRSKSADLDREKVNFNADNIRCLFKEDKAMGKQAEQHFLRSGEDVVDPDFGNNNSLYHLDTDTTSSLSDLSRDDRKRILHKKKIIIDLRRTLSSPGDELVVGRPLETIDPLVEKEGEDRIGAPRRLSLESSDSSLLSKEQLTERDMVMVEDEYLPHRSKWTRLVDSTLGYWGLSKRFRYGTVVFADGSKFHGCLKNGKPTGRGYHQCFSPGCEVKFRGEWRDGKPHGRGVLSRGQDSYWGEMKDGVRHGKGIFIGRNGRIHIKGVFKDDKLDGGPTVVNLDDSIMREYPYKRYVGQMENGLPQGHGKMTWGDGVVYSGKFKAGKRAGYGTVIDKDGQKAYVGQWRDDMPHGRVARMVLPDGKVYTGEMARGQRQGLGELFKSVDGSTVIYEGMWRNDLPEGAGIAYAEDGKYEGEWRHGKRSGKGTFTFNKHPSQNGPRRYKGDWLNDVPHGLGQYLDSNGLECMLKWENGTLVQSSMKQYGKKSLQQPVNTKNTNINSHDPNHWGRRRKIEPEKMLELHSTGVEGWTRHATKPFAFVAIGTPNTFSNPPQLAPPQDPVWNVTDDESPNTSKSPASKSHRSLRGQGQAGRPSNE